MSRIAVVSYPIRARECIDYLQSSSHEGSSIILCPYRSTFSRVDLHSEQIILPYRNRLSFFRSRRHVSAALKSQLKYFLGSGSFGIGVKKALNFLISHLASLSYGNEPKDASDKGLKNQPKYNEPLFRFLNTFHQEDPIEEIIVFDICDLPTALEFSEPKGIRTLIR